MQRKRKAGAKVPPKLPHKLQQIINIYRENCGSTGPYDWRYVFSQTVRIDYKNFSSWDK